MRLGVAASDNRNVEIAAYGLPCFHGVPLILDTTMCSPLHCDGTPHPRTASVPGIRMQKMRENKGDTYPELVRATERGLLKFIVLPCEVGGRWGEEWIDLIPKLAQAKARSAPKLLRRSAEFAWTRRWWDMLAVAAQGAFAGTLVGDDVEQGLRDGFPPPHSSVMSDSRYASGPANSRLPSRG